MIETCRNGHPRNEENTYIWMNRRQCRSCRRDNSRRSYSTIKASEYYRANKERRYTNWKTWKSTNIEYYRQSKIAEKYNISVEEYQNMQSAQNGVCAICGQQAKLVVDHNHKTGQVRKLLCNACNLGLGKFKEDLETLRKAVSYLEAFNVGS